jgi:hypothetical protein
MFVAPVEFGSAPTSAGDYHLQASSPAIGAGSNAAIPADTQDLDGDLDTAEPIPFDRDGNSRIVNGLVDMGAYETQVANLLTNGGFELAGDSQKDAADWLPDNLTTKDKRRCTNVTRTPTVFEGSCAFRFAFDGPLAASRQIKQVITGPGIGDTNDLLTLSIQASAANLTEGARLVLKVTYADDSRDKAVVQISSGSFDYTYFETSMGLTQTVIKAKVMVRSGTTSGTLWFDDVKLALTGGAAVIRSAPAQAGDGVQPLPLPVAPDGFRGSN